MKKLKLFFACLLMAVLSIGQVWADVESGTTYTTDPKTPSVPANWTVNSYANDANYTKLASNANYIQTDEFCQNGFTSIKIKARKFGGPSAAQAVISVEWFENGGSSTVLATVSPTGTSLGDYTLSELESVTGNKSGYIKISCKEASGGKGCGVSQVTITYTAGTCGGGTPTCATPTFLPAAGSYEGTQNVTISSTADATIYYTTDGSTPSASSSVYSSPIAVSADMTIKAYAVKAEYDDSEVAEAAYTITEGPDVTINLLDEGWGFPTTKVVEETAYTYGGYTIKVAGNTGNGFRTYGTYFMLGQTGAYLELPVFTSPIEKIVVAGNGSGSGDVAWNIYQGETAVSTAASGCKNDAYTFDIAPANQKANVAHAIKVTNAKNLQIKVVKIYFGEAAAVEAPTFSLAAGTYAGTQSVTLACETEGSTIYYTTDGTAPTNESTEYTAAISVSESQTIKAIAYVGSETSSVATAEYTILTPQTTMDQIFAVASADEGAAKSIAITFNNWVVSGAKGNTAYVTDGTKGFIVYYSDHGFQAGDILSGTAIFTIKLYNGAAEVTAKLSGTVTATTGGTVSPVILDAEGIAALTGVNTGSVIKISGECTYESSKYYIAGVQLYNTLYSFSVSAGTNYECTGVYLQYNSTKEMLPRSAADIVAQTSVANPAFSVAAGTYTEVQNVALSCATDGATIYYTTDGSTPDNTSTAYSSAIEVGASMTIKAIAYKGEDHSEVVSAAYTINLPEDENVQKTWDLSIDETATASEEALTWTATYVDMSFAKGTSTTNANNYYPGTSGQSYTSTRTYKNSVITITPASSKQITTVVFTATTEGYATTLKNAAWTNATATATGSTVTVTAAGSGAISAKLGGTAGFSAVTVHYEPYVAPTTYAVSFAAPEHGTLTISNGETPIASGDEFEEGTELTVSTEPASGYILDAIKVIETGSDPENDVTSTVLAGATLTVPAYAITVSATFVENVAPVATLTLSENGVEAPFAGEHHQGDVVNLPLTSSADCVKDFVGWSANASCAVAPEYAPGAEYTLASTEQTLYAVYATASGSSYVKTALASIASGSEVVVTELYDETIYAAANDGGTSAGPSEIVLTESATDVLNIGDNTNIFWIISKDGDNFSFTVKGGTDKLYCTNTNNGVRVGTNENNVFSINSNYLYNNATSRYVGYNHQDGGLFRCYTSINGNINNETLAFYKKTASYSDFATTCVAALADPEFTPAAGSYTEAKNIVITAEEGTIYYTTDGTDPTSASTEYTAPIVLDANGTTTIKAIAINATSQSAIVSATYTINLPLSTIQAVYDKAVEVGGTATAVNIKFTNWVVSGISTDNKNVYVTDGEKGFVIYDSEADHGFAVNDKLNGTVATSLKLYNKYADVIGLKANAEGLTVTHDGVITPVAATIADLGAVNTGAPIILNGVLFDGSVLSDGVNSITPYTTFYADAVTSLESDKYYNITGIYVHFNSTKEIAPRSAADIVESVLVDPEISYSPASVEITQGDAWSAPSLVNPHSVTIASYVSDNEEVATVTDGGVISLAGGTGTAIITAHSDATSTYAAGNATYTITVNAPAPAPSGTTYRKVTATADITDGEYLIVYETTSVAFDGSLETLDAVGNTVDVTINEGEIAGTAAIDAAVFTIDVTAGSIKSASNKYIGVSSYSNGLSVSDDAGAFVNALSIDADENAVIVITTTGGDMTLRYNSASNQIRFRYYKNAGQQAIQLYKKETVTPPVTKYTVTYAANGGSGDVPAVVEYEEGETFSVAAANLFTAPEGKEFDKWNDGSNDYAPGDTYTVGTSDVVLTAYWKDAAPAPVYETVRTGLTPNHYYTICYPKAMTDIQGATLWSFVGRDANFAYIEQETATTIEAGKPYIMYATASTVTAVLGDETNAPGANGAIHGTFSNLTQEQLNTYATVAGNDLYLVIGNELRRVTGYALDGITPLTGNSLPAQRAFVVVGDIPDGTPTPAPGKKVRKMPMQGQTTTGCEFINAAEAPAKMMINGQLFILRGEKKYDATGRLVK